LDYYYTPTEVPPLTEIKESALHIFLNFWKRAPCLLKPTFVPRHSILKILYKSAMRYLYLFRIHGGIIDPLTGPVIAELSYTH